MTKLYVEIEEEHADILINALDLFSRIGMGQLEEIVNVLRLESISRKLDHERYKNAECMLFAVKKMLFNLESNAYYGIFNDMQVPSRYRTAYDIQCVLRKVIARIQQHNSLSVWHNDPLHANPDIPLITCKVVEEDKTGDNKLCLSEK